MELTNERQNVANLINTQIPEMELEVYQNDKVKTVKLSDYQGKWLIIFFYPADFTFVCPTELREMAENYEVFKKLGAEVISVSCDTIFAHKAWHDSSETIKQISFPMAADPTAGFTKAMGVYIEGKGEARRGTFVVNPKGIIKAMEVNDNSIGRSAHELVRKLQTAIFVEKHGDQVCPASWQPGDKTLKPGLDLVGKI